LVDVLTFEIELVNIEALEKLEVKGLKVYPSPKPKKDLKSKGKDFLWIMTHLKTPSVLDLSDLKNVG
jgi:5-(carboxyamino)imidazole ribonucleotide synthase